MNTVFITVLALDICLYLLKKKNNKMKIITY